MSRIRWYVWKAWNRTRYYWPQAQARKRAIASLTAQVAEDGMTWKQYRDECGLPRRPWWIP